jgi:hypothetical protein
MEVNLEIKGIRGVVNTLRDVPGGARFALRAAIIYALRRSRTEAKKLATSRYNVTPAAILKAIGTPTLNGLTGILRASGSRFPLSEFPHREIVPYGVVISELKNEPPINLLHAFVRGGRVLERTTPQGPRLPIWPMVGRSVPGMIGDSPLWPKLEESLQKDLDTELSRLVSVILAGGIIPRI